MERITNVTPENISDRIERERKAWSGYSFSEENLPKEAVKEETQIPIPPPTPPAKKQEVKEKKKVKKVTDEAKKGKFGNVG